MPWEQIGECGSGDERDVQMGLAFLVSVFDTAHEGKLGIMYSDSETGQGDLTSYASIGLHYQTRLAGMEDFAARLQEALMVFDDAVDWSEISPDAVAERCGFQINSHNKVKVLDDAEDEDAEDEDDSENG